MSGGGRAKSLNSSVNDINELNIEELRIPLDDKNATKDENINHSSNEFKSDEFNSDED
jgi:hypothetical protein